MTRHSRSSFLPNRQTFPTLLQQKHSLWLFDPLVPVSAASEHTLCTPLLQPHSPNLFTPDFRPADANSFRLQYTFGFPTPSHKVTVGDFRLHFIVNIFRRWASYSAFVAGLPRELSRQRSGLSLPACMPTNVPPATLLDASAGNSIFLE